MTEDEFWERVGRLGGQVEEAGFDRLTAGLAAGPIEELFGFAEQLDAALRRLDLLSLQGQHVWDTEDDLLEDPPPLDRDGFLDARAAVICAGREIYERVQIDPASFAGIWDFSAEMLLYVPVEAYEARTGKPWPYQLPGTEETVEEIEAHRQNGHGPDVGTELAVAAEDRPEPEEPGEGDDWSAPVPESLRADVPGTAVRLDLRRHAFWLVEVAGSHDLEPVEGFLADPAPAFEIPSGAGATTEWPDMCAEEAFPAASARITEVMRAHGGLAPLPLRRMAVVLVLATDWDLTLRLRPYSGALHVAAHAAAAWSREDAIRAVTGLAAHVVLEAIQDYRVEHRAAGDLLALRDAAADLVPF
ncbi:MAG TPA: DUF4240 domain-containing protein [Mycobacteriales bacterium]|jgi:hypothetical protein|nr:DUF4240 domain-containing protein [Mycobacteriales bacterium]